MSCGSINPRKPHEMTEKEIRKEFLFLQSYLGEKSAEYTIEEMKKIICENISFSQEVHKELSKFMKTDEYAKEIVHFYDIDPDEVFKYYKNEQYSWNIYIEYTDDEKRALGIKTIVRSKEQAKNIDKYAPRNEFIPNTNYILFETDNASQYFLVPSIEFTKIYSNELDMLRKNAELVEDNGIKLYKLHSLWKNKNKNAFSFFNKGITIFANYHYSLGDIRYGVLRYNTNSDDNENNLMDIDKEWYTKSILTPYSTGYRYFDEVLGKFTLPDKAIENGCTVKECFIFLYDYPEKN